MNTLSGVKEKGQHVREWKAAGAMPRRDGCSSVWTQPRGRLAQLTGCCPSGHRVALCTWFYKSRFCFCKWPSEFALFSLQSLTVVIFKRKGYIYCWTWSFTEASQENRKQPSRLC